MHIKVYHLVYKVPNALNKFTQRDLDPFTMLESADNKLKRNVVVDFINPGKQHKLHVLLEIASTFSRFF